MAESPSRSRWREHALILGHFLRHPGTVGTVAPSSARLAREIWNDDEYAAGLERQAADLKRRFNRDFWIGKDEYFALALGTDGKQVDALTSNNGHLLWSGIVDK